MTVKIWHNSNGCHHQKTTCVVCALFLTYCQVLGPPGVDQDDKPVLAERRREVDDGFTSIDAAAWHGVAPEDHGRRKDVHHRRGRV